MKAKVIFFVIMMLAVSQVAYAGIQCEGCRRQIPKNWTWADHASDCPYRPMTVDPIGDGNPGGRGNSGGSENSGELSPVAFVAATTIAGLAGGWALDQGNDTSGNTLKGALIGLAAGVAVEVVGSLDKIDFAMKPLLPTPDHLRLAAHVLPTIPLLAYSTPPRHGKAFSVMLGISPAGWSHYDAPGLAAMPEEQAGSEWTLIFAYPL